MAPPAKKTGTPPFTFHQLPSDQLLKVNTDKDRHYVIEKSEEQGILDIRKLTNKGHLEEKWVYVEGTDDGGKLRKLWYEIGEDEKKHEVDSLPDYLNRIYADLKQRKIELKYLREYHQHPAEDGSCYKRPKSVDFFSSNDFENFVEFYRNNLDSYDSLDHGRGIITPASIWMVDWKDFDPNFTQFKANEVLDSLIKRDQHARWVNYNCIEEGRDCDNLYDRFAEASSSDWVEVRHIALPVKKCPELIPKEKDDSPSYQANYPPPVHWRKLASEKSPGWMQKTHGISIPISLGLQHFVFLNNDQKESHLLPSIGAGAGYLSWGNDWSWDLPRWSGGGGISVDYATGQFDQDPQTTDRFDLLDLGVWGQFGLNYDRLDLIFQPALGFRHTFIKDGNATNRFWAGGDAGIAVLDHGLYILAQGKYLPAGEYGLGGAVKVDLTELGKSNYYK